MLYVVDVLIKVLLIVHDPDFRTSWKNWESFVETLTEKIMEVDETIPELPPKDLVSKWTSFSRACSDQTTQRYSGSIEMSDSPRIRLRTRFDPALKLSSTLLILSHSLTFLQHGIFLTLLFLLLTVWADTIKVTNGEERPVRFVLCSNYAWGQKCRMYVTSPCTHLWLFLTSSCIGAGLWMPESQPLAALRRDIDRKPHKLKQLLANPAMRKHIFGGIPNDEKKLIKAFTAQNTENALKTKPKVRCNSVCV
jgi:hypothetical protein